MAGLAIVLTAASQVQALDPLQGAFLTATSPIERLLGGVFRPIASFLSDAGNLGEIQDENRQLLVENERLQNRVAELERGEALVKELEEALNITRAEALNTRLIASVVHRDASAYSDVMSINRGSSDGVEKGMVVVSAQGSLLGSVTKTLPNQSFVRLITDSRSRVTAQVQDSQADGVVKGGLSRKLSFEFAQAEIREGDIVVTSGLGGNFPPGIPVARVSEVAGTPQDLFRKVGLEPLVRISTVQTVLVITSFLPEELDVTTR